MPISVTMPQLSDTMEEGTLVQWHVRVGDTVRPGDHLADVETDKATMDLKCFDEGVVTKIVVQEGHSAAVGDPILTIQEKTDGTRDIGEPMTDRTSEVAEASSPAVSPQTSHSRINASPVARRLAQERNLDLAMIAGTGPNGRITKSDVIAASPSSELVVETQSNTLASEAQATAAQDGVVTVPLSKMRKAVARTLTESVRTIPHFTVEISVNADPILAIRQKINAGLGPENEKLSITDLMVRASAVALTKYPEVNSTWHQDAVLHHEHVNIGIAVDLSRKQGGGLVVPTLRDVQAMAVQEISREIRRLTEKSHTQARPPVRRQR